MVEIGMGIVEFRESAAVGFPQEILYEVGIQKKERSEKVRREKVVIMNSFDRGLLVHAGALYDLDKRVCFQVSVRIRERRAVSDDGHAVIGSFDKTVIPVHQVLLHMEMIQSERRDPVTVFLLDARSAFWLFPTLP